MYVSAESRSCYRETRLKSDLFNKADQVVKINATCTHLLRIGVLNQEVVGKESFELERLVEQVRSHSANIVGNFFEDTGDAEK